MVPRLRRAGREPVLTQLRMTSRDNADGSVRGVAPQAPFGPPFPPRDVDQVGDLLEGEEGDRQRQDDVFHPPTEIQRRIQRA